MDHLQSPNLETQGSLQLTQLLRELPREDVGCLIVEVAERTFEIYGNASTVVAVIDASAPWRLSSLRWLPEDTLADLRPHSILGDIYRYSLLVDAAPAFAAQLKLSMRTLSYSAAALLERSLVSVGDPKTQLHPLRGGALEAVRAWDFLRVTPWQLVEDVRQQLLIIASLAEQLRVDEVPWFSVELQGSLVEPQTFEERALAYTLEREGNLQELADEAVGLPLDEALLTLLRHEKSGTVTLKRPEVLRKDEQAATSAPQAPVAPPTPPPPPKVGRSLDMLPPPMGARAQRQALEDAPARPEKATLRFDRMKISLEKKAAPPEDKEATEESEQP